MSKNWVVVPTCLPIVVHRCHRCASGHVINLRSVQPELLNLLHDNHTGRAAELRQEPAVRRHGVSGRGRTGRPAWQSPYGPATHRAHRGRWAPVPGVTGSRSVVRHGYLCGRCD
ncbi:hypothetical protein [Actinacidiphila acididurans]|uniref:Secreted protein n=1 Tax=Actinacidiphila acididurans TaxID=2784346 RepID=A0ABS2TJ84_9ACTN|nr:hypothetical protein [Actinacidiphila acididurans]MBM9503413.1 hypothetical protein [Actinacidiphila acididurans]